MWQSDTAMLEDVVAEEWRPLPTVGDIVCVRPGTSDPDFPARQLDGWIGKIVDRDETVAPVQCLVQWNDSTIDRMSSDERSLCEWEDFAIDQMWLLEEELDVLPL